uniref:Saccharopine dehydrogenase (NAD(+), L-lysine-forming) n=1 Tax=Meloidogyne javanica TaxID=6303 RepID=A0A915MCT2_MELJA
MYLCTLKLPLKSKFIFRIIRNFHSFTPPTPFRPQNYSSYLGRGVPTVGIRRETINAWERRVPLTPNHVKVLTKKGVRVIIQPSNRRAFPIQDYIGAGATVQEDLSQAQLIVSVKQVPVEDLIPNKTYAFFSHTIKAQQDNMEMLDTHNYSDSHMAINAVRDCGYEIALNRMPRSIGPLIFVFTGTGNVSKGAQELFRHFPHEFVDASTLPQVAKKGQLNKVYGCVVSRADHMIRKEGGTYKREEFEKQPELYVSKFASEIAPYATVILNCVFWGVNTPRLLTIPDAKILLTPRVNKSLEVPGCPSLPHRLMAICDISADPGGSIEFMTECTTIDKPFTVYDADLNQSTDR